MPRFEKWMMRDRTFILVKDMTPTHLANSWMLVRRVADRAFAQRDALYLAEATDPNEMYCADGDAIPHILTENLAKEWCERFADELNSRGYTLVRDFRDRWCLVKLENLRR